MFCENCGAKITERDKFCSQCGSSNLAYNEQGHKKLFCENCGTEYDITNDEQDQKKMYCTNCGEVLTNFHEENDDKKTSTETIDNTTTSQQNVSTETQSFFQKYKSWIVAAVVVVFLALIINSCNDVSDPSLGVKDMIFTTISETVPIGELISSGNFCDIVWTHEGENVQVEFHDTNDGIKYKIFFKLFNNGTQASFDDVMADYEYMAPLEITGFCKYLGREYSYEEYKEYIIGLGLLGVIFNSAY